MYIYIYYYIVIIIISIIIGIPNIIVINPTISRLYYQILSINAHCWCVCVVFIQGDGPPILS
jgi:hypothetical protein